MYEFSGFFTTLDMSRERVKSLWQEAATAPFREPAVFLGVRFAADVPEKEEQRSRYLAPLLNLSAEYPEHPFVYVEAECWAGECSYRGEVFRAGREAAQESGSGALGRLVAHLGIQLDEDEYFVPFERSVPWR